MELDTIPEPAPEGPDQKSELDSRKGVFRDTAVVEYHFFGLIITGDHLSTVIQSFETDKKAIKFIHSLLTILGDSPFKLTRAQLTELEYIWTGERPEFRNQRAAEQNFSVLLTFATWLTDEWNITKRLFCLAVTQDAVDVLIQCSRMKTIPTIRSVEWEWGAIEKMHRKLRYAPPKWNLLSTIFRVALRFATSMVLTDFTSTEFQRDEWESTPRQSNEPYATSPQKWLGLAMIKGPDVIHSQVYDVYRNHQIGRREPDEPYIRHSVLVDNRLTYPNGPIPFRSFDFEAYDIRSPLCIVQGEYQKNYSAQKASANLAIYRISEHNEDLTIAEARWFLESRFSPHLDIYKTPRWWYSKKSSTMTWNHCEDCIKCKPSKDSQKILKAWALHLRDLPGTDKIVLPSVHGSTFMELVKRSARR